MSMRKRAAALPPEPATDGNAVPRAPTRSTWNVTGQGAPAASLAAVHPGQLSGDQTSMRAAEVASEKPVPVIWGAA